MHVQSVESIKMSRSNTRRELPIIQNDVGLGKARLFLVTAPLLQPNDFMPENNNNNNNNNNSSSSIQKEEKE